MSLSIGSVSLVGFWGAALKQNKHINKLNGNQVHWTWYIDNLEMYTVHIIFFHVHIFIMKNLLWSINDSNKNMKSSWITFISAFYIVLPKKTLTLFIPQTTNTHWKTVTSLCQRHKFMKFVPLKCWWGTLWLMNLGQNFYDQPIFCKEAI